jgi:hypothetical protein
MRAASCLLILLAFAGCAEVLDIPEDPALVGRWRCLGAGAPAPVPLATNAVVQVQACDFIDNCATPVTGLTARLCAQRNVGCTNPLKEDIFDTNGDGLLTFDVPTMPKGFNGYLEVTSTTALCTGDAFGDFGPMLCGLLPGCDPAAPDQRCQAPVYARAMLFFNPPISQEVSAPLQLPLIPTVEIPAMLGAAGAQLNPGTGNLFITALDCDGVPASGVTYGMAEHQESVTQLYMHGGLPNKTDLVTDESGVGGFLGVPGGFAYVTAYNENLEVVGETSVQTAPFTMTYTAIAPF